MSVHFKVLIIAANLFSLISSESASSPAAFLTWAFSLTLMRLTLALADLDALTM